MIEMNARLIAAILAIIFSMVAVILTVYWVYSDFDTSYLGGLNTNHLLFNWHPVLMVSGMILCAISSLMSFRILPFDKLIKKYVHATLHTLTIACICLGLTAVFQSSNNPNTSADDGYSANLVSMHSYLGIIAIIVYGANYILGFTSFLLFKTLNIAEEIKAALMPYHIFLGICALFAAVIAVETGIMELSSELTIDGNPACSYSVTSADMNPAVHYSIIAGKFYFE
mmetsp:Transcript_9291/g.13902  ORF Transcript_9291/g.13902 Transcript_9291/m.13902 type:complete len:227 (+) Transcript_9291:155-835(+)